MTEFSSLSITVRQTRPTPFAGPIPDLLPGDSGLGSRVSGLRPVPIPNPETRSPELHGGTDASELSDASAIHQAAISYREFRNQQGGLALSPDRATRDEALDLWASSQPAAGQPAAGFFR